MTPAMDHEKTADLLGAYALDALDTTEAAGVDAHLAGCPRCRAELYEHRTVVGLFSYSGAEAPQNVWERIALVTATPPPGPTDRARGDLTTRRDIDDPSGARATFWHVRSRQRRSRRHPLRIAVGAVAAAGVLLVCVQATRVGFLSGRDQSTRSASALQPDPAMVVKAVESPGARLVRLSAIGEGPPGAASGATAVLLADGTGYLFGSRLASLPANETYQLWGQVGNEMVSYGLLGAGPGTFVFRAGTNLTRLAVSAEQAGGVAVSHNVAVLSGPVAAAT